MQGTGSMISLPPPPNTPPDEDKGAPAQQVSDNNVGKVKRMQAERGKIGTMGAGKEEATRDRFQKQSQLGDYDKGFFRNIGTTIKDSVVDLKGEMTGVTSTKGDMAASYGGLALTGAGAGLKKLHKTVPNKSLAQTLASVKTPSFGKLAALSQAAGIFGLVAGAIKLVAQCFKIKDATKGKLAKSAAKADVIYDLREIAARTLAISLDGKADWDFGLNVTRVDPSTIDKDAGEDQMKQLAALTDKAVMDSTNLSGKAQAYWEQRQKIAKAAKLDPTSAEVTAKTEDWVAKFVK